MDELGVDLLEQMLKMNPDERISAEDALKHPYFDDIQGLIKTIYK